MRWEAELEVAEPQIWPIGDPPEESLRSEAERLVVLASFDIAGLQGDPELADIARFAARLCETPSCAVSLVEAERQLFVACAGLSATETPRSTSLCAHAMQSGEVMQVPDASKDPRFADFAMVTGDANLRFYAGAPLISSEGAAMGALCVTDTKPRPGGLTAIQKDGLLVLAEAVKRRIESHRTANRTTAEVQAYAEQLRFTLDSVPDIAWSATPGGGEFDYFNARWEEFTGIDSPTDVEGWRVVCHPDDFEYATEMFAEAVATASPFAVEWRMRMADGSYRWMLTRAVPSSDDPEAARWFGTITDIDDRYRISQERELLAGELAHRIKNIFSVINGLVTLNAKDDPGAQDFAKSLNANILALSRAQDFALRIDGTQGEELKDLLGVLMAPYGASGSSAVAISGDAVEFGPRAATPLALVFHELATNSAKYGALSIGSGTVAINVTRAEESVTIEWQERGGPPAEAPEDRGFGSRLIALAINHQLGGTIEQEWRDDGLRATIEIPAARLSQ
ncbi:MAG: PAS domain-containing protein [Pseudomonadota bacterium]